MNTITTINLTIIWEDELRTAARLLKELEAASDEDYPRIAGLALQACVTALWGVDDKHTILMLGAASLRQAQERATDTSAAGQP